MFYFLGGKPYYPEILTVRSSGYTQEAQKYRMGIYKKVENLTIFGRPVWKRFEGFQFLFYSGKKCQFWKENSLVLYKLGDYWLLGNDYTEPRGGIQTINAGLLTIPQYGWQVNNGSKWFDDITVNVTG